MSDLDRRNICGWLADALNVAGTWLGVAIPPAGAALATGSQVLAMIDHREGEKQSRRANALLQALAARVSAAESDIAAMTPERVDLFQEFMRKAIADDDETKTEIHAAFITWAMTSNPQTWRARVLGDAIRSLTRAELTAFANELRTGRLPDNNDSKDIDKEMYFQRLNAAGLSQAGGVRHNGSPTSVGRLFGDVWTHVAPRYENAGP